jgi:TRAP-type C4-dicarboxylate transport system substrate-binding protein
VHNVIDGPIGNEILASLDAFGFAGLTFYDSGARTRHMNAEAEPHSLQDCTP